MNQKNGCLVLFGLGSDNKPHAAWFEVADEIAVRKAAYLMKFKVRRAETDEARALARKLPEGKIFGSGNALVPFVKQDLYDQLLIVLKPEPANGDQKTGGANGNGGNGKRNTAANGDDPWAAIKSGSVVLCRDPTDEPSWWECAVVAVTKDAEILTVRWQNYPKFKPFTVNRRAVAILPPATNT